MSGKDVKVATAAPRPGSLFDRVFSRVKREYVPRLFVGPALVFLLVVTLFPTLYSIILSFRVYNLAEPWNIRWGPGETYAQVLSPEFLGSILTTLRFTVCVVLIEFLLGFGLAMLINRFKPAIKRMITILIIIPMMITPVVVGLLWKTMYNPSYGVMNYLISLLGLGPSLWASGEATALASIMLTDIWQWTPFMILLFVAGLAGLPRDVYEASQIDGASGWRIFRRITVPLMMPLVQIAVLLRLIDALKVFDIVFVLTKGGPGTMTETMAINIYLRAFQHLDVGVAAARSVVFLVMTVILSKIFLSASERAKRG